MQRNSNNFSAQCHKIAITLYETASRNIPDIITLRPRLYSEKCPIHYNSITLSLRVASSSASGIHDKIMGQGVATAKSREETE
jgi:hypothetical protein